LSVGQRHTMVIVRIPGRGAPKRPNAVLEKGKGRTKGWSGFGGSRARKVSRRGEKRRDHWEIPPERKDACR